MNNEKKGGFAYWCKTYTGQKYITSILFLLIPVILLIVFTFIPALQIVPYSFQERGQLSVGDQIKFVGLDNYKTIFTDSTYLTTFKNSLYYLVGSFVQQIIALLMATILCGKIRNLYAFKHCFLLTSEVLNEGRCKNAGKYSPPTKPCSWLDEILLHHKLASQRKFVHLPSIPPIGHERAVPRP